MIPSPKKWPLIRNDPDVEIGLVQVVIGGQSKPYDHFTDLIVKRAKEVLKDTLVTSAGSRGGKLSSWNDDGGTFLFPIETTDSLSECCLAAIHMLEQLPSVKREAQLPADLEPLIMVRIACDTGSVGADPDGNGLAGNFVDDFKKHEQLVSAEALVTITERVFRQLNKPLKSRFVKWRHSTELGIDLYRTAALPENIEPAREELPPEGDQSAPASIAPSPGSERMPAKRRMEGVITALGARKVPSIAGMVVVSLLILGLVLFLAWPRSPATVVSQAAWQELVQSEEWRSWRKQIHDKLAVGKVTEKTLAEALKIKLPDRPEDAPAALRRDLAIADVLMTYPDVRLILKKRFGIYEDSFLGTGLSKPRSGAKYGAASVHEYLIPNLADNDPAVWTRTLNPNNPVDMTGPVRELFENDPKAKGIVQRVQEKDSVKPAVIRFATLAAGKYSRKLGRLEAHLVFASNLAEVWNTRVIDAANLSGHIFTKGDVVYVWAFLPYDQEQVVPATWGEVVNHLPRWLTELDTN